MLKAKDLPGYEKHQKNEGGDAAALANLTFSELTNQQKDDLLRVLAENMGIIRREEE